MGGNNASLLESIKTTKKSIVISSEAVITAHTTFNNNCNTFLALAEQLEDKLKEIEAREHGAERREKDIEDKYQQLHQRESTCNERERKIETREKEVVAKEEKWVEVEKKMKENANKLPNIIKVNVGGTTFAATKEKLLSHNGSLLEHMITTDHNQHLSATGEIFIERDSILPSCLQLHVEWQATSTLEPNQTRGHRARVCILWDPHQDGTNHTSCFFFSSSSHFRDSFQAWQPGKRFELLYRASQNGFGAADFHRLCNNRGPTLTTIRSTNGYHFGGYTPLSWNSTNQYKTDNQGFIFTLTNPHYIPPTKYHIQKSQSAIYCNPQHGPTFGGGYDMFIWDNSQQTNNNKFNFPVTYNDTTEKGSFTFTGTINFTTTEIEVFAVL